MKRGADVALSRKSPTFVAILREAEWLATAHKTLTASRVAFVKRITTEHPTLAVFDVAMLADAVGVTVTVKLLENIREAERTGLMRDGAVSTPTPERLKRPKSRAKQASRK